MANMRVYEVAKHLGMPTKDLMLTIKSLGMEVSNSFSVVDANQVYKLIAEAAPAQKRAPKPQYPSRPAPPASRPGTASPLASANPAALAPKPAPAPAPAAPVAQQPVAAPAAPQGVRPQQAAPPAAAAPSPPAARPLPPVQRTPIPSAPSGPYRGGQQGAPTRRPLQPAQTPYPPGRPPMGDARRSGGPGRDSYQGQGQGPRSGGGGGYPPRPSGGGPSAPSQRPPLPVKPSSGEAPKGKQPYRGDRRGDKQPSSPRRDALGAVKPKKVEIKKELDELTATAVPATTPTGEDVYATPSKRYDAIKQKGLQQQAPRKGQKITFLKKRGGKRDKDAQPEQPAVPQVRTTVRISGPLTVKELSNETGTKSSDIIMFLMKEFNLMTTLNHTLDLDLVKFICEHFTVGVEIKTEPGMDIPVSADEADAQLETRPPVVTIMGHVDHGKTKLLDAIRHTDVVATESGGITQHIGAYQIAHQGRKITFLDTPGHASFTALRARGAQVTDLAVLVVAADDGVMPQTIEAIDHARAAKVPILVALNKIDKPSSNIDRVKRQLSEKGLQPEEWGGDTVMVEISAKMKQNIEELIDMMFLVTDIQDLKATPTRKAVGTVIEAQLDKGKGPAATVLVQTGTLYVGDQIVCGLACGRVRAMENDKGEHIPMAGPSTPVKIFGLDQVPESGDQLFVLEDEKTTREIVAKRRLKSREEKMRYESRVTLEDLFKRIQDGQINEFKIIIKGDVQGSVEAITQSLEKIEHEQVRVKVIRSDVGEVSETDVMLAAASSAVIMTFHTGINPTAHAMALRERVDVRNYDIIYRLIDDVKMAMVGMLAPEFDEEFTGRADVRKIFASSRIGNIAGCYVEEGEINSNSIARVIRDKREIFKGKITSLKRFKDNIKVALQGYECGIVLDNFSSLQEGDKIEAFKLVERERAAL